MNRQVSLLVLASTVCVANFAAGQGVILDIVANKLIDKYQSLSCEQLWQHREQPKSEDEQRTVKFLHNDPQARRIFLNEVAAPVANEMVECGMTP